MNKGILRDYIDACALIEETEQDIKRLKRRRQTIMTESVKGSMSDFPYAETHFKVAGASFTYSDDLKLRIEEKILVERKEKADALKLQVEEWMNTLPFRMQRIIRYKFFDGLSWEQIAEKMKKKATENSLKKEFERFMKEN